MLENSSNISPSEKPADERPTFVAPSNVLSCDDAPDGIRYDFNYGLRVSFPSLKDSINEYRCVFYDMDSGMLLYSMDVPRGSLVESVKKYFVRYRLEIYEKDKLDRPVFTHDFDLKGKTVLLQFPYGAVGDTIAWFSYARRFQKKHNCNLVVSMEPRMAELFKPTHPEIRFIVQEDVKDLRPYATYNLGLWFNGDTSFQPYDFREVGLHRTVGYILGLDDEIDDEPPQVLLSAPRRIKEKYVCIATQASSQCKYWNNPSGWREVIIYLKSLGYRVLCMDLNQEYGFGFVINRIPWGCDDFTGQLPLQERVNIIKDADLFIGLSSGLSWLAWCCKVPIVMISGFTDPVNEFKCHRVINTHVCHGCWHDVTKQYDHHDFLWCPHADDKKKFECTMSITSQMVIRKIDEALGVKHE